MNPKASKITSDFIFRGALSYDLLVGFLEEGVHFEIGDAFSQFSPRSFSWYRGTFQKSAKNFRDRGVILWLGCF